MGSNLQYANAETPKPSMAWIGLSEGERIARLQEAVAGGMPSITQLVAITSAKDDGQVIVSLQESLPASQRGVLLLDLESFLKGAVDTGLAVWLEALGDRNSLRNLRGIEVKA